MSGFYHIVSTLPPLVLGEPLPITKEAVLDTCRMWLSASKIKALEELAITSEISSAYPKGINHYLDWEHALRNRLVFLRCYKQGSDPDLYTRNALGVYAIVEHSIHEVMSKQPLEKERTLDEFRWNALDFLTREDRFNFAVVCAYLLKLQIGAKWIDRNDAMGSENLKTLVQSVTERFSDFKQY